MSITISKSHQTSDRRWKKDSRFNSPKQRKAANCHIWTERRSSAEQITAAITAKNQKRQNRTIRTSPDLKVVSLNVSFRHSSFLFSKLLTAAGRKEWMNFSFLFLCVMTLKWSVPSWGVTWHTKIAQIKTNCWPKTQITAANHKQRFSQSEEEKREKRSPDSCFSSFCFTQKLDKLTEFHLHWAHASDPVLQ